MNQEEKSKKKYAKEQGYYRRIMAFYGSEIFSFPHIYKLKLAAYTKAFSAGKDFRIGNRVKIYRTHGLTGKLSIGSHVFLTDDVTVDYSGELIIEDNVTISEGTKVYSHKHDLYKLAHRISPNAIPVTTRIEEGAWIGAGSIILGGVTIGHHAVVGAGSVVTHDVAPLTIVGGNPAKFIKDNSRSV